jgi:hypothetical protein
MRVGTVLLAPLSGDISSGQQIPLLAGFALGMINNPVSFHIPFM